MGANSFLKELTPNEIGGKNENDRVASHESEPIHLTLTDEHVFAFYHASFFITSMALVYCLLVIFYNFIINV